MEPEASAVWFEFLKQMAMFEWVPGVQFFFRKVTKFENIWSDQGWNVNQKNRPNREMLVWFTSEVKQFQVVRYRNIFRYEPSITAFKFRQFTHFRTYNSLWQMVTRAQQTRNLCPFPLSNRNHLNLWNSSTMFFFKVIALSKCSISQHFMRDGTA